MFQPRDSKLWAMEDGSSQIYCMRETHSCLCWVLQGGIIKDEECMFHDCVKDWLSLFKDEECMFHDCVKDWLSLFKDEECMFHDCVKDCLSLFFVIISTLLFVIWWRMFYKFLYWFCTSTQTKAYLKFWIRLSFRETMKWIHKNHSIPMFR
jgi:hypothetical protein